jgi:hypothetical protein
VPEGSGSDGTVAPRITVRLTPELLFPPNHQMVEVHAGVAAVDACGAPVRITLLGVSSSEPDDRPGEEDGNTLSDIDGADPGSPDFDFRLRAERDETGPGRIYTVLYAAEDRAGAVTVAAGIVRVPTARRPEPPELAGPLAR